MIIFKSFLHYIASVLTTKRFNDADGWQANIKAFLEYLLIVWVLLGVLHLVGIGAFFRGEIVGIFIGYGFCAMRDSKKGVTVSFEYEGVKGAKIHREGES